MPNTAPRKEARDVLNVLCETLAHPEKLGISKERGIVGDDILTRLNIRVHPLEVDPHTGVSMTVDDPPFLFSMPRHDVFRTDPLREKIEPFPKYLEPSERPEAERPEGHHNFAWSSEARGAEVLQYITSFALNPVRSKYSYFSMNLSDIKDPDPFLWGGGLDSGNVWFWRTHTILEAPKENGYPTRPHITMTTTVDRVGQDNSIFYEELIPLVCAMRNRADQPKIPPQEWESAFELWDETYDGKLVFEREKTFPILMLSFLGPQHARVFYARIKDDEVIIGQSKLYSFERKDNANIELFARLLLSAPARRWEL
ncbi:hypothetical protein DTO164E3_5601 [Paecilomyces variotii]|nr:hypothetical protein DTO164E3_5601 [Paecilomyces variotii]KAJ9198321.1 hypothetical protein DTO032I3_5560 [Paecilomyces variotii]KAJ9257790.1 hypothetical protein DTO195F2_5422 [Paecilomyces variotii]KAJ9279277.1 hypothetical protein DTO021D3_3733 [Paecilomyces variotii]KAJ9284369.1 hypothetical protein DTO021C3_8014 [Paecilomyces variotii]